MDLTFQMNYVQPSSMFVAREIKQKLRRNFSEVFFGTPFSLLELILAIKVHTTFTRFHTVLEMQLNIQCDTNLALLDWVCHKYRISLYPIPPLMALQSNDTRHLFILYFKSKQSSRF